MVARWSAWTTTALPPAAEEAMRRFGHPSEHAAAPLRPLGWHKAKC